MTLIPYKPCLECGLEKTEHFHTHRFNDGQAHVRVYVDMDGPLADFDAMVTHCTSYDEKEAAMKCDGFFMSLPPVKNAIAAMNWLDAHFDTYILSTAPWNAPRAWMEKRLWVEKWLPRYEKRLILSHNKDLHVGHYLIDDRTKNGAGVVSRRANSFW